MYGTHSSGLGQGSVEVLASEADDDCCPADPRKLLARAAYPPELDEHAASETPQTMASGADHRLTCMFSPVAVTYAVPIDLRADQVRPQRSKDDHGRKVNLGVPSSEGDLEIKLVADRQASVTSCGDRGFQEPSPCDGVGA